MPHVNRFDDNRFNGDYSRLAFGQEKTVEDITRRIAWETEAEGVQRKLGHNAIADAHALAREAYVNLLEKKKNKLFLQLRDAGM